MGVGYHVECKGDETLSSSPGRNERVKKVSEKKKRNWKGDAGRAGGLKKMYIYIHTYIKTGTTFDRIREGCITFAIIKAGAIPPTRAWQGCVCLDGRGASYQKQTTELKGDLKGQGTRFYNAKKLKFLYTTTNFAACAIAATTLTEIFDADSDSLSLSSLPFTSDITTCEYNSPRETSRSLGKKKNRNDNVEDE